MRRSLVLVGPALEATAIVFQLRWHAANPDTEPFGNLFLAHSGIYAGIVLGAIGAAAWWRDRRFGGAARVVLGAALLRFGAVAIDAVGHAGGSGIAFAHDLYRVGIGAGLLGAGVVLARAWSALSSATRHERRDGERGEESREPGPG